MRILVTRPVEDAAPLVAELTGLGHEALIEPLLAILPCADAVIALDGVQALLFTSANGVRAFAALSPRRDLPAFAVGDATAACCRDSGFTLVESAGGDVEDLARLVSARLSPSGGSLLHPAASAVAGDLSGQLQAQGFTVRRQILYRSEPATHLGQATISAFQAGAVDAVLFFSPRTAATFVTLARNGDLERFLPMVTACCLSAAVAEAVAPLAWRRIVTAAKPTKAALLAVLGPA